MAVIKLDIFSYIKIIQFLPAALKTVKYNSAEFHTGKVLLTKKKCHITIKEKKQRNKETEL